MGQFELTVTYTPAENKNVIHVTNIEVYDAGDTFSWTVTNRASTWVAGICQLVDDGTEVFNTAHIQPLKAVSEQRMLDDTLYGKEVRIFRWAPDGIGIPGSGGGEARIILPPSGSVILSVDVV